MTNADLHDSFNYQGKTFDVEWFDADAERDLPNVTWQQVYAVAKLENRIPLVLYGDGGVNLPGGKTNAGEGIHETLHRELIEETNCRVLYWEPIGYQKVSEKENGKPVYQLRVYAELEKVDEFKEDPGGSVIGYKLIELTNLNTQIQYGKVGDRIMQLVKSKF